MKRDNDGFTLLETVISLSIVAAIAATLVLCFRLAGDSIERGEGAAREAARLRAGIAILERTIRSADRSGIPAVGGPAPFFLGERERLRFVSSVPLSGGARGGYRLLCYSGGEDDRPEGGGMTVSESSPFRAGGAASWEGKEGRRVFLPGAREVVFTFSPGPSREGKWEWVESWDAREAGNLPAAVRVEFVTRSGGSRLRTSFVVPVLAGG